MRIAIFLGLGDGVGGYLFIEYGVVFVGVNLGFRRGFCWGCVGVGGFLWS